LKETKLILASNSPRRQQLLKEAGINFLVLPKNIPEDFPSTLPLSEVPIYLAKLKAEAFKPDLTNQTVITADTVVIVDNTILNKPENEKEAIGMLELLSGNMHQVITGVCIYNKEKEVLFSDVTEVYFKPLSKEDITFYVSKFKPFDKAGSYGVQEWIGLIGVERINGSYFNVMGLPIHRVVEELKKFGILPFRE
jgi:septum formation protein